MLLFFHHISNELYPNQMDAMTGKTQGGGLRN